MKNNIIRNIEKIFTTLGFQVEYRTQLWDTIDEMYLRCDEIFLENDKGSFWVKVATDESVVLFQPNSPNAKDVVIRNTKKSNNDPA